MDLTPLLRDHIYTAIALGSLVEGETTVVLAGFAAHQGYAPWTSVVAFAAIVNLIWDQCLFALGLWRGPAMLRRWPALRRRSEQLAPRIHRHRRWMIFGVRFMYGLRTAGPVALGIAQVPWRDFVLFNTLGAVVWSATFASLGYLFGRAVISVLGNLAHAEASAVAVVVVAGLAVYVAHKLRERRRRDATPQ